jgi:alpha-L-fucosidase 2
VKQVLKKIIFIFLLPATVMSQPAKHHNLSFEELATKWDEAIPLGNGMLGALVWQKKEKLRFSLDRADLWDERKALDLDKFNFKWVKEQVVKKDYAPVQNLGDYPYDHAPYPTKLPAAAMEFDIASLGKVVSNVLDIQTALNTITFENGAVFKTYVHATEPAGYFIVDNPSSQSKESIAAFIPQLVIHNYNAAAYDKTIDSIVGNGIKTGYMQEAGEGLQKLAYAKGNVSRTEYSFRYHQPTYNNHYFEVLLQWQIVSKNRLVGRWTITNDKSFTLKQIITKGEQLPNWDSHCTWWKKFWDKSSIHLPDSALEKQYYLEMYKLGCVARKGAPAITLQAVWTADNGSLPPWKGDFHNDLNTQLSYWPTYTSNRMNEATTFTDWLWKIKDKNTQYTKKYFGVDGLNVPGVVTLNGDPMGGWIQYSLSPTVSAWASQYFYWQWKYSMDELFLKSRAYPYIHAAAVYLENITYLKDGIRKLPLSSSPEYNDNNLNAWFEDWTNFDLSLSKFLFNAAIEVSKATGNQEEAKHWKIILEQLPGYGVNETGLSIAPGANLDESHRHMSQAIGIYPLALLDYNKPADKTIIDNSLQRIEQKGTSAWCGYSFSWAACLYARAYKADSAVKELKIFASNFCSVNSFHLNGDQKGGQYSNFTYRPFTLEGNFAFAQGVNELLLQSRSGYIEVFPAIPTSWANVSFNSLRTEGGFLISAEKKNGATSIVTIKAEKAGKLTIKLPADITPPSSFKTSALVAGAYEYKMQAGETVSFKGMH